MLAPSERYYLDRKRRPNKLTDRARQLLWMVKQWPPERSIVVVADSSFAALNLLAAVREQLCVVTPLHLDAALYDPAPARAPDTRGRPPLKGARQPTLKEVLASDTTFWRDATLSQCKRPPTAVYPWGPHDAMIEFGAQIDCVHKFIYGHNNSTSYNQGETRAISPSQR